MADEAFALSPISARAALPSEQDYDAIREAFMETSRGRWFLGEYAKRNRNADTAMVLDAVARIEQAMAAQRQEPVRNDDGLNEALAAIRSAVEQAAEAASTALAGLQLDEKLAPIHKGARIIREISWRWREIGADGRICDLIDSQLAAIESSCTEIGRSDGSVALGAAFDLLRNKLDELAEGRQLAAKVAPEAAAQASMAATADAVVTSATPPVPEPTERPAAQVPPMADAPIEIAFADPEPAAEPELPAEAELPAEPELPAESELPETGIAEPEAEPIEAATLEIEPVAMRVQAAAEALAPNDPVEHDLVHDDLGEDDFNHDAVDELAQDEAVLEMVAIEMAAPDDSIDDVLIGEQGEVHATLPPVVAPVVDEAPEPVPAPRLEVAPEPAPRLEFAPPPRPQILAELAPPVVPETSLGATLIASGILQRPKPTSDPLAPIRRMSQAEKIAFFS